MKKYKKVLPIEDTAKVSTQIGRVPLSVMEFVNEPKWDCAYYDQDDSTNRRSKDAKYLPELKFSEFSSSVCEFILRYWSMKGSRIVDPFAGRATRAVISSKLGREYYGYEISPVTYNKNLEHFKRVGVNPTLYLADGCDLRKTDHDFSDLVMTCPPYFNIEKYESVDRQLSDCENYEEFLLDIKRCAENVHRIMKKGSFFCWVCADWRDSKGYRTFTHDSMTIFKSVGLIPHDTVIIKNNTPFAALQAGKCAARRIVSKIHEYILVFKKSGDYNIPEYCSQDEINENFNKFFE